MIEGLRADGAMSADGTVMGTYVHGLFASTALRGALISMLGATSSQADYASSIEDALNEIAEQLEQHIDIDAMVALAKNGISRG